MNTSDISAREDTYIAFVDDFARRKGMTFLLDAGDGNEMPNPPEGMYVEDLSGWLLTPEQARLPYVVNYDGDAVSGDSSLQYGFILWQRGESGELAVDFVPCDDTDRLRRIMRDRKRQL